MGQSSTDYKQLRRVEFRSASEIWALPTSQHTACPIPPPLSSLLPFLSFLLQVYLLLQWFPVIIIILSVIHFKDPLSYSLSNALANKNLFGLNNPCEIGEAPLYKWEPEGLGICWKPHSLGLLCVSDSWCFVHHLFWHWFWHWFGLYLVYIWHWHHQLLTLILIS